MTRTEPKAAAAAESQAEATRHVAELRRWARWSRNQRMKKSVIAAALFIEAGAKLEVQAKAK